MTEWLVGRRLTFVSSDQQNSLVDSLPQHTSGTCGTRIKSQINVLHDPRSASSSAYPLRKAYVVKNTTCCGVFDVVKITISCGVFY